MRRYLLTALLAAAAVTGSAYDLNHVPLAQWYADAIHLGVDGTLTGTWTATVGSQVIVRATGAAAIETELAVGDNIMIGGYGYEVTARADGAADADTITIKPTIDPATNARRLGATATVTGQPVYLINVGVDSALRTMYDGAGTATALSLSTTTVGAAALEVGGGYAGGTGATITTDGELSVSSDIATDGGITTDTFKTSFGWIQGLETLGYLQMRAPPGANGNPPSTGGATSVWAGSGGNADLLSGAAGADGGDLFFRAGEGGSGDAPVSDGLGGNLYFWAGSGSSGGNAQVLGGNSNDAGGSAGGVIIDAGSPIAGTAADVSIGENYAANVLIAGGVGDDGVTISQLGDVSMDGALTTPAFTTDKSGVPGIFGLQALGYLVVEGGTAADATDPDDGSPLQLNGGAGGNSTKPALGVGGSGGDIEVTGGAGGAGDAASGDGGGASLIGGVGEGGGSVIVRGGYGNTNGGTVNLDGGDSGSGSEGSVEICGQIACSTDFGGGYGHGVDGATINTDGDIETDGLIRAAGDIYAGNVTLGPTGVTDTNLGVAAWGVNNYFHDGLMRGTVAPIAAITNDDIDQVAGLVDDVLVVTLPARTVLHYMACDPEIAATFSGGGGTLTLSLGIKDEAGTTNDYEDIISDFDGMSLAPATCDDAGTTYDDAGVCGDGDAERGDYLPNADEWAARVMSFSATTSIYVHVESTVNNLDTLSSGLWNCWIAYTILP